MQHITQPAIHLIHTPMHPTDAHAHIHTMLHSYVDDPHNSGINRHPSEILLLPLLSPVIHAPLSYLTLPSIAGYYLIFPCNKIQLSRLLSHNHNLNSPITDTPFDTNPIQIYPIPS